MKKSPLFVIFLVVFIDLVGFGIIIPLGPFLGTQLGASAAEVGLLMSIYSIMQFIFSPIWGRLSDRIGRRPIILLSLFGATLAHLTFAFSSQLWMMFLARGLAGLFGGNISTAMAYIADVTEEKNRSKGMGLIGAAFGLGFILGPPIGGFLGELGMHLGSRPPFGMGFGAFGASIICLFNFILAYKILKESLSPEIRKNIKPKESRFKLIKKFISQPVLGKLLFLNFLMTFAMSHMEATLALFVKDQFSWDLKKASIAFAYVGVIHVITQGVLIRKLMPKFGEARLMLLGVAMASLGLYGIGISGSIIMLGLAVTLLGVGVGLFNPSNMGSVSVISSAQDQGAVMGVGQSFSAMGRILGPASGGYIYLFGHSKPFEVAGTIAVVGFLIVLSVFKKIPRSGEKKSHFKDQKFIKIGEYQFQNILLNRVPCLMLDLRIADAGSPHLNRATPATHQNCLDLVKKAAITKEHPIVLVCDDGALSFEVAEKLVDLKYYNVVVLEGGIRSLSPECRVKIAAF